MRTTPALDYIDARLRELDQERHAMHQSEFFVRLMMADKNIHFAWLEERLRHLECLNLYLLALPQDKAPGGLRIMDPAERYKPLYWVRHAVNGYSDRATMVREYGLPGTAEVNLQRLAIAGYLVPATKPEFRPRAPGSKLKQGDKP